MGKIEASAITIAILAVMWMIPAAIYRWALFCFVVLPLIAIVLIFA